MYDPFKSSSSGNLYLIVGPSGVGKDTLIALARKHLPQLYFIRRYITRSGDSGGENHVPVTQEDFEMMIAQDEFCVWWQAHDLHYGIHKNVQQWVESGKSVVINGSRNAIDKFEAVFPKTTVIHITASEKALRARLTSRGRENTLQIEQRLQRSTQPLMAKRLVEIDNSGPPSEAVEKFIRALNGEKVAMQAAV